MNEIKSSFPRAHSKVGKTNVEKKIITLRMISGIAEIPTNP